MAWTAVGTTGERRSQSDNGWDPWPDSVLRRESLGSVFHRGRLWGDGGISGQLPVDGNVHVGTGIPCHVHVRAIL